MSQPSGQVVNLDQVRAALEELTQAHATLVTARNDALSAAQSLKGAWQSGSDGGLSTADQAYRGLLDVIGDGEPSSLAASSAPAPSDIVTVENLILDAKAMMDALQAIIDDYTRAETGLRLN